MIKTAVKRKRNVPGFRDANGVFHPLRSPSYVGKRRATSKDKRKYSRAKAGDLGPLRQERALEAPWDREHRLRTEAAEHEQRGKDRLWQQIESESLGSQDAPGKGKTLLQFVRSEGGIRRTFKFGGKKGAGKYGKKQGWDSGEIDRLSYKETGKRGLTTDDPRRGKTMDKMYQAALEAGYDLAGIDDLMERVESEAAGRGETYATRGFINYTENPGHRPSVCVRDVKGTQYVGKSYKSQFTCPICKRSMWQHLGFLGQRKIVCNGVKFTKIDRKTELNPSAAKLAKAAIAVFDNDLDLDLDLNDIRRLQKGERAIAARRRKTPRAGIGKKAAARSRAARKNPDPVQMFAHAASGMLSALQIKEMLNRPKVKKATAKRGTTKAKRRNPGVKATRPAASIKKANPAKRKTAAAAAAKTHFLMAFGVGSKSDGVYLSDGIGLGRKFATAAAARKYAAAHKIKLVSNPAGKHYTVKGTQNGRRVQFFTKAATPAAAIREIEKYQGEIKNAKATIFSEKMAAAWFKARGDKMLIARAASRNPAKAKSQKPKANGILSRAIARGRAAREYKRELRLEAAAERSRSRRRKAEAKAKGNPAKVPARRTFEMFQGRPATKAKPMAVSRHAPAWLDQLGDLVEIKLHGMAPIKLNGRTVKLCAAGGKLWIAGKRFAKPNPSGAANAINPVGEIDHVVYGTFKPHHGDHEYTHYIHKLGEESGKMPMLCVDREGFPVIRGGNYKIEARGIVD